MSANADAIESADRATLRALQLTRLQDAVLRARGVPHYRAAFEAADVAPGDLHALDDIARFPFTVKDDLRAHYPFGLFAVPRAEIARIHASSGTTGKSTVVGYTRDDLATWASLMARCIRAAGGRPGDMLHNAFGYGLFTGGLGFHDGATALGCAVVPIGGGFTERQVQLIVDFRPQIITATPSYLLAIADEFDRQGLDPRGCGARLAICGAEPWSEGMRAEIEGRLGLCAFDSYGLSEVMGPGVGQERADAPGALTLWEDHFYPEIIDPETGVVLPDGERGELVLTALTKQAMPAIRYRTRDLTRLLPATGASPMRRIERIMGRCDDMLIIRGVNVFPTQIEAVFAHEPRLAPHYVLEVSRPERLDELAVHVELRFGDDSGDMAALEGRVAHLIKAHVGVSTTVRVLPAGVLERSQGKAKRVIDKRTVPA